MEQLNKHLQQQFQKMMDTGHLFVSSLNSNIIWDLYLSFFTDKQNPVFRDPESSTHNCNNCKNFIRRYGNIVAISDDNTLMTLFDVEVPQPYTDVFKNLSEEISKNTIKDVFAETFSMLKSLPYESCKKSNEWFKLGIAKNSKAYTKEEAEKFGVVSPNETRTFHHFNLNIHTDFIDKSGNSSERIQGHYRDLKNVFERGLNEISVDVLTLAQDLINQNSLLNGTSYLQKITKFIALKEEYDTIPNELKNNWLWMNSKDVDTAKFRNTLIGTFCVELMEGKELNKACLDWNKRADPANYMKATAPISKSQIESAKAFVEEQGYTASFDRRLATIEDIRVTEIKHINQHVKNVTKGVSLFDDVKPSKTTKRMTFEGVDEIPVEKFIETILPKASSVEAYVESKFQDNLAVLTKGKDDTKPIFKWDNNYSWTYKGNLAGKSEIKRNVKNAGGNIEALLRCSLQWNDEDTEGVVDFDLHCTESPGDRISYLHKKSRTGGFLDVDMIRPFTIGIENITYKKNLPNGSYKFFVRNYDGGSNKGFKVQIEVDKQTFDYVHPSTRRDVPIATVIVKDSNISIEHHLSPFNEQPKTLYGLESNQFHKVNLVCLSPNHWGKNNTGNKHLFFMLEGAKADEQVRSFHVENLSSDLLAHRKVMEVLANTTMIEPKGEHLAGLGFNFTVRDSLIVRVKGTFNRILKIKF
jgi:hypothetical protein